jgi:hypothetical protein
MDLDGASLMIYLLTVVALVLVVVILAKHVI